MNREEHLSEVSGWEEGTCMDCRHPFPRRGGYERRCPLCYKVHKEYKVLWGDQAFLWAQTEIMALRKQLLAAQGALEAQPEPRSAGLKGDFLREVIFLCHPDKHGNSEKATKVTQKLNQLRGSGHRRKQ